MCLDKKRKEKNTNQAEMMAASFEQSTRALYRRYARVASGDRRRISVEK